MTKLRALAWLCLWLCAAPVCARPYTVDDLLALETLGPGVIDPSGRWLIQEYVPRYDAAPRFDSGMDVRAIHAKLLRIDLLHPGPATPAFSQEDQGGYVAGPFSPSGRSMVVYRDLDQRWELGVLTIATGQVRWLGFGAEFADLGETVAWRSETALVALRMPPGDTYSRALILGAAIRKLPGLWEGAADGRTPTMVATGSGRYSDIHPPERPRDVVEVDTVTGGVRVFATGAYSRLALSASGRKLALIETYGRIRFTGAELLSQTTPFRQARLQVLDLDRGVLTTPCAGEPLTTSLRWSPTADRLLAYVHAPNTPSAAWGYVTIDAEGGCHGLAMGEIIAKITSEGDGATITAHGEWLGSTPMVLGQKPGSARGDWFAAKAGAPINLTAGLSGEPADPLLLDGDHAVFLDQGTPWSVDVNGAARHLSTLAITRPLPPQVANMTSPEPAGHPPRLPALFALSTSNAATTLLRITGTHAMPISQGPARAETVVAASDAGMVIRKADPHGVEQLALRTRTGEEISLFTVNQPLASVDFAVPHEIDHVGPNGEALKSWLYLPAGATGSKPPLLVMAYPGANFRTAPFMGLPGSFVPVSDNIQLAVSHGYAVLTPTLIRPAGSVDPGKGWSEQIFKIVDQLKATWWVDTDRVGYWGHSFGGYTGLMMATETNRFRAIVAAAPLSDLISSHAGGWPASWLTPFDDIAMLEMAGWAELGAQGHLMGTPWTVRDRYIDNSPVFFADKVTTPILLVQGDQDQVGIDQGREMFSALLRLGKDAEFLTFYGEAHGIGSPANLRVFDESAFAFLDGVLKDERTRNRSAAPNAEPRPLSRP